MGVTHFRSDVKEQGTRKLAFSNASIVTATINTLKVDGVLTTAGGIVNTGAITSTTTVTGTGGVIAGSGKYFKLGSIYIITGAPAALTTEGIAAVATLAAGVSNNASIPRGSLFLNASSGGTATQRVYVKFAPATWAVVTTGSQV